MTFHLHFVMQIMIIMNKSYHGVLIIPFNSGLDSLNTQQRNTALTEVWEPAPLIINL
jgi:hypothetical protein